MSLWACVAIVQFADGGPPEQIVVCEGSERRCVRASEILSGTEPFEVVEDGELVDVPTVRNVYVGDRVPVVMTLAVCAPGSYEDAAK